MLPLIILITQINRHRCARTLGVQLQLTYAINLFKARKMIPCYGRVCQPADISNRHQLISLENVFTFFKVKFILVFNFSPRFTFEITWPSCLFTYRYLYKQTENNYEKDFVDVIPSCFVVDRKAYIQVYQTIFCLALEAIYNIHFDRINNVHQDDGLCDISFDVYVKTCHLLLYFCFYKMINEHHGTNIYSYHLSLSIFHKYLVE